MALSCLGGDELAPLPLDLTLVANKTTASVGDSIAFTASARGGTLVALAVDFGDASTSQFDARLSRTFSVSFKHAYGAKGTFQVSATITDVTQGQKNATLQVAVP